jgi:putative addiction module component (TIGR02574 family)
METAVNKASLLAEILRLPEEERAELVDEIIESLPAAADDFVLTEEQKAELDRRIAEHERDPSRARPWEEVREWLWSRRK